MDLGQWPKRNNDGIVRLEDRYDNSVRPFKADRATINRLENDDRANKGGARRTLIASGGRRRSLKKTCHRMISDPKFQEWHPLGTSIDLVKGEVIDVAEAVRAEMSRFVKPDVVSLHYHTFEGLSDLFGSVDEFTNVPTRIFCIGTTDSWTALWNNSFLCDGYDSLCHCLTLNHGLETIHWSAADEGGIFQPGTSFSFRTRNPEGRIDLRAIYAIQEDSRWEFHQSGSPLPQEDTHSYISRRKKDRFNESVSLGLLDRLGAQPRSEAFYDFSQPVIEVLRETFPATVSRKDLAYIRARAVRNNQTANQAEHAER